LIAPTTGLTLSVPTRNRTKTEMNAFDNDSDMLLEELRTLETEIHKVFQFWRHGIASLR
jgi:hypothetical protein